MCHGLASVSHARDGRIVARVVLCLVALVALMADPVDAVEEVHLPFPPPVQGLLTAGPYNFQFTGEDHLRVSVANSLTGVRVAVHYRTAPTPTTTQANRQDFAPTADRTVNTQEFDVGQGYLLNVVCFASSGAPRRGQTYVKLEVIRGFGLNAVVLGCVCAGYVTASQPLAWPGSPIDSSTDGDGYVRNTQGTMPAIGGPITETVPTGARWELLSFLVSFQAGAGVGTRTPGLAALTVAGYAKAFVTSPYGATASQTWFFTWQVGVGPTQDTLQTANLQWPPGVVLFPGEQLHIYMTGMTVFDQFTTPAYTVREWLEV